MSLDTPPLPPNNAMPAEAIGTTINEITSRYAPNIQRALRMSATSPHSTTATWNWRGRQTMARKLSRVWARKPTGGDSWNRVLAESAIRIWCPPSQLQANRPTATIATSLTSDSSAMASIMPWWCSVASTWRVPNRAANRAISRATYSAGSAAIPTWPASWPDSTVRLIATALYCSAT